MFLSSFHKNYDVYTQFIISFCPSFVNGLWSVFFFFSKKSVFHKILSLFLLKRNTPKNTDGNCRRCQKSEKFIF